MDYLYPNEEKDAKFFKFWSNNWKRTNFIFRLFCWPLFFAIMFSEDNDKKPLYKQPIAYGALLALVWFVALIGGTLWALSQISAYLGVELQTTLFVAFGLICTYVFVLAFNAIVDVMAIVTSLVKIIWHKINTK